MDVRITNLFVDESASFVYAADDRGLVRKLSLGLELLQTSPALKHGACISAIAVGDGRVFTRDILGNLMQWDAATLQPRGMVSTGQYTLEFAGETAAPNPSQAMAFDGERIWCANPFGELQAWRVGTLAFERSLCPEDNVMLDSACFDRNGRIYAADTIGGIWQAGREDPRLQVLHAAETPLGTSHSLVHDARWDRLWCSTDNHGGVLIVGLDGAVQHRFQFTRDDVEQIAFSGCGGTAYIACFDHYIYRVDNREATPRLAGRFGPFKFQVNHVRVGPERTLYATLESGELYALDADTGAIKAQAFGTDAVWGIDPMAGQGFCAGLESGALLSIGVQPGRRGDVALALHKSPDLGFGRVRRVLTMNDGALVGISTSGAVFRSDLDGRVEWTQAIGGILRDIVVGPDGDSVIVASEDGHLSEIDLRRGALLRRLGCERPVWCLALDADGTRLVIGERSLGGLGAVRVLDADSWAELGRLELEGNPKRLRALSPGRMLMVGNGAFGARLLDTRSVQWGTQYREWVMNTVENGITFGSRTYLVTYGQQLLSFDTESAELKSVQFSPDSFPKGLAVLPGDAPDEAFLLMGGREFLSVYRIGDGIDPALLKTVYLARDAQGAL